MVVQVLSVVLSATMRTCHCLLSCNSVLLPLMVDKACLVLGIETTTGFPAIHRSLCLRSLILSLLFAFIFPHFLQFLCFHTQFAYCCLNDGIPLITIWRCFFSIFVNLASLQVLGNNVCPLHLSPPTARLPTSNLQNKSFLGMLHASILALCPRHLILLSVTTVSTVSMLALA